MRTARLYIVELGLYTARHVRTLFSNPKVVLDPAGSHKSRIIWTDQQLRDSNLESFGPNCGLEVVCRLTTQPGSKDGSSPPVFTTRLPLKILIPGKLPNFGFCSWVDTLPSATCVARLDLLYHHHLRCQHHLKRSQNKWHHICKCFHIV